MSIRLSARKAASDAATACRKRTASAASRVAECLLPIVLAFMPAPSGVVQAAMDGAADRSAEPEIVVARAGPTYTVEADVMAQGVRPRVAWDVLTDYARMSSFMPDLRESRVTRSEASGERLIVEQKGVARLGILFRSFETIREVRLRPYDRVITHALGGTVSRATTETRIIESPQGTRIRYRIEVNPGFWIPEFVTEAVIRHNVRAQFRALVDEMVRRQAARLS